MLDKIKKQENIVMIFFIVVLIGVFCFVILEKNVIDVIYFVVLLVYFIKFLILKYRR